MKNLKKKKKKMTQMVLDQINTDFKTLKFFFLAKTTTYISIFIETFKEISIKLNNNFTLKLKL